MVYISFILKVNSNRIDINKCLSSFFSQNYKNFEIILIMDEGNKKLLNQLLKNYPKQTIHYVFENGDSYHEAINMARGTYISFFNSKTMLFNEYVLDNMISFINNNNLHDMFSANISLTNCTVFDNSFLKEYYVDTKKYDTDNYNFNLTLPNNIFKKEFLINENINYDYIESGYESLFFAQILTKVKNYISNPIFFCKTSENDFESTTSNDYLNIFREYKLLLNLLTRNNYFFILENITKNLLNNLSTDLFKVTDYDLHNIKSEFDSIEKILKKYNFNQAHDIKIKLRYTMEVIESHVTNYDTLISIIIPTYNVEKYVEDCLYSIINQSFNDFEIIVVDDLSTDSTVELVENLMKKDSRIKLFKNSRKLGSGGSRNFGIKQARGKYIQFVDGDDWLDYNTLRKVYDYAEKFETQIVMFKIINFDDTFKTFYHDDYFSITVLDKFNNQLFGSNDIYDELFEIFVGPINKLYLKSFIDDIGVRFPEKYIHQDNPFFYHAFCESEKIYFMDEYFYNRRVRKGSITTLRDDTELGTIEIVEEILKVFINNGLYCKFNELLLNRLLFKLRNRFNLVGEEYKEEYFIRTKRKLNKFMFDYDLYDDLMKYLWLDNKNFFEKIIYSKDYVSYLNN